MARRSLSLIKDVDSQFEILNSGDVNIEVYWSNCFICQSDSDEKVICPANSKHSVNLKESYRQVANDIKRFEDLNSLSQSLIHQVNVADIEQKCVEHKAVFHKRCRSQYDNLHYERAVKKIKLSEDTSNVSESPLLAKTRSQFMAKNFQMLCFLCNEETKEGVCKVQTLKLDKRVRDVATKLLDEKLMAKLSEGDLVATEACYHKTCLASLYNRVRIFNDEKSSSEKRDEILEGMALAEVVAYIKQCTERNDSVIPVFQLKKLNDLHERRLAFYGCSVALQHATRFKEKLLEMIPELSEHKKGRKVILTLTEGSGEAIFDACDLHNDGMCLTRAARIIRKELMPQSDQSTGIGCDTFSEENEAKSVSAPVHSFINMILNSSDILNDENFEETKASLTICELLHYNIKRKSATTMTATKRKVNESPLPLYIGLMIHSKTRKKGLIDELSTLGLSVPYKRVVEIQTNITKQLCKEYQDQETVCPPRLQEGLFTVTAIDNLDHNPTSTTASKSFHGTGISIFQYTYR